ncbi:hypothetical protein QFC22_001531 [Naganishia vaughanmartiniae]|uniref:Uncharacterized protein n=1 Tax=Naganishia vaughanmartiniae TaxID=1424756 RepID=A0ACC2XKU6_9TREE|nr:hypothetical protein QFC22_001531 [Naganishia vaughanmartiniae]
MSERSTFLYNLGLFGFTSVLFLSYSIVFARHVYNGLSSDILDELVWITALAATIFYAQAVHASYQTYIESQGGSLPPLTVGPFTILPGIIGPATTPILGSTATYQPISTETETFDRYLTATPDLEEEDSGYSGDNSIIVSPPTPTGSESAYGSPRLQTPGSDFYTSPKVRAYPEGTPSKPSALIRKISGDWFGRRAETADDIERGNEMHGLGMGSLENSRIRV